MGIGNHPETKEMENDGGPPPPATINVLVNTNSAFTAAADATEPPPPSPKLAETGCDKGEGTGVFYRNWTVENARELGLKGWVRNRRDGSVEALFSGNPDSVHEMEQRCRRGLLDAMVTYFQVFPSDEDPGQSLDRKPTV